MGAGAAEPIHAGHGPDHPRSGFVVHSDDRIVADGHEFGSWSELARSGYFHVHDRRCAVSEVAFDPMGAPAAVGSGADCSFNQTNPDPQYDPSVETYRIPVVVHVIQSTGGTGFISESRVESQIEILNEDFQALSGSNGANGNNAEIEFYLATEDPSGNPTNGITYSTNNSWFNDNGSYWNSLAWDTDRYLNIYTNQASGALGYVPDLPQGGIVGSNADRVVVLYSSFGGTRPLDPFDLGRTTTHEVGHYLGLFHTFQGGCTNGLTSGDRITDTNPHFNPTFGCPGSDFECGGGVPIDNYMNYSDDACMEQFTAQQNLRMRCTLINYRPDLYEVASSGPCGLGGHRRAVRGDRLQRSQRVRVLLPR